MKIPLYKRLFKTDFASEEQPLVEKISGSVNDGIENLQAVLNKNTSLSDNIYCIVKDIDVIVNESGIPKQSIGFNNSLNTNIIGIQVIKVISTTNSNIYPSSGPFITFTEIEKVISIKHITGLPANNKFTIKIVAYG